MIYLLRCNSIISDSRAQKYIDFYNNHNIKYRVLGWDRLNEGISLPCTDFYNKKSGYNVGGMKAAKDRLSWMKYIVNYLRSCNDDNIIIHACDLDTAFPACIYKSFFNKKAIVIFDIFDWYSDNLSTQSALIKCGFKIMEKYSIKHSDEVIICEEERIKQIPYHLNKKELIFPNIPFFQNYDFLAKDNKYKFNNNLITLSYVGGFVNDRCLDILLQLVENKLVNLLIAGFGQQDFVDKCSKLSKELDNIKYFGKVKYSEGLNIMYNSDIIYAMYSKISPNNIFAAPNKYYEAMLLGKAIISTKGIILENKIQKNNIGYIVEESYKDMSLLIKSLKREDINAKSLNAQKLWDSTYCNYTKNFLENDYWNTINSGFLHKR